MVLALEVFQSLTLRIVLQVTVVDFPLYELLCKLVILESKCLDDVPKLKAFVDRFEVCEVEDIMSTSAFELKFPEYYFVINCRINLIYQLLVCQEKNLTFTHTIRCLVVCDENGNHWCFHFPG